MVSAALLLGLLLAATVTDVGWRRIGNAITYPGIALGLLGSVLTSASGLGRGALAMDEAWWGFVPFSDAVTGFLVCGSVMLVCYVFFPGGIGGGDVKLLAMIGTFLGLYHGLEALLWTFVLGGCQALIGLVWKLGALTLMRQAMSALWYVIRTGGQLPLPTEPEQQVSANLFLSPSALLAVLLVRIPALFQ